jgi:hypothetical protein
MKKYKFNLVWAILLCTAVVYGQKQTKRISENFKVNKDVLVEINARQSNVTVEIWNKNEVSISGTWEVEGMTKEEADKYFEDWNFEALGNKDKVVINSGSSSHYYAHSIVFDDMDFDFDIESITHIGEMFDGDFFSDLPPMPPIPELASISVAPPLSPLPAFPAPAIHELTEIDFDYEAYQKDKVGYMNEFEKRQKAWEKEFKEKFEPQMREYEEKIKQWEKEYGPQMKAYEEKMKEWEIEVAPQIEVYEIRIEKKIKKLEKEMSEKYAQKMKNKDVILSKKFDVKMNLIIKVPKGAILKVNSHHGKIALPDNIKTIN